MLSLKAWVLSLMIASQPSAPWRATYPDTAAAIADASEEAPVFAGAHGRERSAALLVSLAWFESRFDPHASGDHGESLGLFQINRHNFTVPAEIAMQDPYIAAREALRLVRESFRVCRGKPLDEQLGWYAAGGVGCDRALDKSRHRVRRAVWLERRFPFDPGEG